MSHRKLEQPGGSPSDRGVVGSQKSGDSSQKSNLLHGGGILDHIKIAQKLSDQRKWRGFDGGIG